MLKKLRIKFICINMVIVTAMLCVMFGTVLHFTQQSMERESLSMMRSMAKGPIRPGRPGDQSPDVRLPFFTVEVDPDGSLNAAGGGYYDLSDETFLRELLALTAASGGDAGVLRDYGLRFLRMEAPHAQVVVFADMSSETRTLDALLQSCLCIGAFSFAVFLLISVGLARWAVKPVEEAWKRQRQFVGDASHELKTPLTVIITNAELLRSNEYDDGTKRRFSANILTMSHQMKELVERLLDLARMDGGGTAGAFSPVDLSKLVSDAALPFEPVFFEQGLSFSSQVDDGLTVSGNAAHLKQLVDILLDNAQKYSLPNTEVALALKKQGRKHCLLSVSSRGSELSKGELKDIFKRFYRADPARSRDGSYGLGLSIAEGVVRAHRGKIWAESSGGVNTFFAQLPRAAGQPQ